MRKIAFIVCIVLMFSACNNTKSNKAETETNNVRKTEQKEVTENKKKKTTIQDTFETNIENISLTLKNLLENQNLFRLFSEPSDRKEVFCKIQEIFEELSRTFYISEESRNKFFTQEILHPWKKASIHIDFEISDKMNSVLDECEKYFEEKIEEKDI